MRAQVVVPPAENLCLLQKRTAQPGPQPQRVSGHFAIPMTHQAGAAACPSPTSLARPAPAIDRSIHDDGDDVIPRHCSSPKRNFQTVPPYR
jgi:hypothetical protein